MAEMKMTVWNVEDGNSISLELPNGKIAMIDAHATSKFSPVRKLYANGHRKVDWLFVTHPHTDHLGDVQTIRDLQMGPTIMIRPREISDELIRKDNANKDVVESYLALDKEYTRKPELFEDYRDQKNTGGVAIELFIPESRGTQDLNDYSRIVLITFGNRKILCMGDCTPASVRGLLENDDCVSKIQGVDFLVAPHHGHESCYCPELFDHISPKLTIVSDDHAEESVSAVSKYEYWSSGMVFTTSAVVSEMRYCLTTRNDGDISIKISDDGAYNVSYNGRKN